MRPGGACEEFSRILLLPCDLSGISETFTEQSRTLEGQLNSKSALTDAFRLLLPLVVVVKL